MIANYWPFYLYKNGVDDVGEIRNNSGWLDILSGLSWRTVRRFPVCVYLHIYSWAGYRPKSSLHRYFVIPSQNWLKLNQNPKPQQLTQVRLPEQFVIRLSAVAAPHHRLLTLFRLIYTYQPATLEGYGDGKHASINTVSQKADIFFLVIIRKKQGDTHAEI